MGGETLLHGLAVEPKGGTTVEKEPFPSGPLPAGGGYVIAKPDEKTQRWEVSAYVWLPSQIIVNQGDEVTMEFVGINGATHPTSIAAFGQTFTVAARPGSPRDLHRRQGRHLRHRMQHA